MATPITFDTLAYAKKLKAAGVPESQAEVHAEAFAEIIDRHLATKQDLQLLETSLKNEMNIIKSDTIKWVAGLLVLQAGIVAALVKLL